MERTWLRTARKPRAKKIEDVLHSDAARSVHVRSRIECKPRAEKIEDVLNRDAADAVEIGNAGRGGRNDGRSVHARGRARAEHPEFEFARVRRGVSIKPDVVERAPPNRVGV